MLNVYEQVDRNKFKSNLVMIGFVIFVVLIALVFAYALDYGFGFVGVALIISGLTSLGSYYYSDKIILSLSGARPADRERDFDFYTVAENISLAAGIPVPKLYVIEDTAMNAFAAGRDPDHAVVVATTGLLQRLDRSEIEAVVAHEISHVANYDIRLMSLVTVLVGMITLLADWFFRISFYGGQKKNKDSGKLDVFIMILAVVLALLSPIIANLIKLAVSRRREYLADASAVKLTRYPQAMITALQKLSLDIEPLEAANKATAHLYISNPLKNKHGGVGWFSGLFSTHPPMEERIATLQSMQ